MMSDSRIDSTREFYNSHVNEYIVNIDKAGITHRPEEHASVFHNYLQTSSNTLQEPFKVLELGCGYGRDVMWFASKGMNVIGTDYSRSMLKKAQESNPSIFFLEMDMRTIANHFMPDSIDGIWACASMIHLPKADIPSLLKSMFTVLRPGGIVYVSVKEGQGETFDPDERYGGIRKLYAFYQQDELTDYLSSAGFEICESGVADHTKKDSYATNPFIHVFCRKPLTLP